MSVGRPNRIGPGGRTGPERTAALAGAFDADSATLPKEGTMTGVSVVSWVISFCMRASAVCRPAMISHKYGRQPHRSIAYWLQSIACLRISANCPNKRRKARRCWQCRWKTRTHWLLRIAFTITIDSHYYAPARLRRGIINCHRLFVCPSVCLWRASTLLENGKAYEPKNWEDGSPWRGYPMNLFRGQKVKAQGHHARAD